MLLIEFLQLEKSLHLYHPHDSVSAGGGCEAAVIAGTRCGWVKFRNVVSCCMAGDFL